MSEPLLKKYKRAMYYLFDSLQDCNDATAYMLTKFRQSHKSISNENKSVYMIKKIIDKSVPSWNHKEIEYSATRENIPKKFGYNVVNKCCQYIDEKSGSFCEGVIMKAYVVGQDKNIRFDVLVKYENNIKLKPPQICQQVNLNNIKAHGRVFETKPLPYFTIFTLIKTIYFNPNLQWDWDSMRERSNYIKRVCIVFIFESIFKSLFCIVFRKEFFLKHGCIIIQLRCMILLCLETLYNYNPSMSMHLSNLNHNLLILKSITLFSTGKRKMTKRN